MIIQIRKILLIMILLGCSFNYAQTKVVGYYPDFIKSDLPPENIKYENLTHILHAFAWPDSLGNISTYDNLLNPTLNNLAHNEGVYISIAFGGYGLSDGFAPMVANDSTRANFVNNAIQFIIDNNYDGIDLDWEFPEDFVEGQNLTILVSELKEELDKLEQPKFLSMAINPGDWVGKYFEYSKLADYLDWFNVMAYDYHGAWVNHTGHNAPLFVSGGDTHGSIHGGITYLNGRGIPKEQMVMGIPFYGRQYRSSGLYQSYTDEVDDIRYTGAANRMKSSSWEYFWDNDAKAPYLLNTSRTRFVTFDDTSSIREKYNYVKSNNMDGLMIWALGQDIVGEKQELLEKIGELFGFTTPTTIASIDELPTKYKLEQNYPNPFNPSTTVRFSIPQKSLVNISIYNIIGKEVGIITNKYYEAGNHEIDFNGENLSSGVYFYSLQSNSVTITKKMILMK